MNDPRMTYDLYRCLQPNCKHRGPAIILDEIQENHGMPGGMYETLIEIACAECGSSDVEEISGE
jgi:hypothetical protein